MTRRGRALVEGLREAAAHLRGELAPPLREYEARVPEAVDVATLRHALGLSQAAFARRFGLDVTAVQAWEQGRRRPDRTARVLLAVIAREPEAVRRALAAAP
ncbi:DNA-binding protein [Caldovatus sediminis]|uniref:DNA-binding protein n=1 Tax=Caldovatus sediminis TaxID=2041189 RepID=A0A8J2ZBF0_9PROT|nr:helix-turn-helix domain-containing protein [Caldovatus sediminis]GGG34053.1 DNA-binding protein [Caldovatus sediminis]